MKTAITAVLDTWVYSPAQSVAEQVRLYAARLGRWVSAYNPVTLLDTPINRAIRNSAVRVNYWTEGEFGFEIAHRPGRLQARNPVQIHIESYSLLDKNGHDTGIERTPFQHRIDKLVRPLLRLCLPDDSTQRPLTHDDKLEEMRKRHTRGVEESF